MSSRKAGVDELRGFGRWWWKGELDNDSDEEGEDGKQPARGGTRSRKRRKTAWLANMPNQKMTFRKVLLVKKREA